MTETQLIYDILKSQCKFPGDRHTGEFGVEIETETDRKYDYPDLKFWRCEKDNSLRDWGVEYILKAPMNRPELKKALAEFDLCEKKYKFKKGSVSTSVHVHVNMLNETYLTLANFLTAYTVVENLLIRYSGPDRLSNLFCLPIRDCEGIIATMTQMLGYINRGLYQKTSVSVDGNKYGAINLSPLNRLGTVEIRSFRGETDTEIVDNWIGIIDQIKTFSKSKNMTPIKIVELYRDHKERVVDFILGPYAKLVKPEDKSELDRLVDLKQLGYAARIATISKDWTKFGIIKIKKVYKEKLTSEINAISNEIFKGDFDGLDYSRRLVVIETYHTRNPNNRIVDANEDI